MGILLLHTQEEDLVVVVDPLGAASPASCVMGPREEWDDKAAVLQEEEEDT